MRLSRKAQYALLFTIYLTKTGLTRTQDVSASLGISQNFIEQIARDLRRANIISVKRGPGGGYQISDGTRPTVTDVLVAVGVTGLMSEKDGELNLTRGLEGRALIDIIGQTGAAMSSVFNQTIESFILEDVSKTSFAALTIQDQVTT